MLDGFSLGAGQKIRISFTEFQGFFYVCRELCKSQNKVLLGLDCTFLDQSGRTLCFFGSLEGQENELRTACHQCCVKARVMRMISALLSAHDHGREWKRR